MLKLRQLAALALLAGLFGWAPAPALAQEAGLAVITSPLPGSLVSGLLPIIGSASHSQFSRYEIAFAYSPNPTDTWFIVQAPGTAPVANDVLARWDTTTISDGVYTLRLRVYGSPDSFLEALVPDVRVANATPTAPPSLPDATATPAPSATVAAIDLPPTSTPRPTTVSVLPGPAGDDSDPPPADSSGGPRISGSIISQAFIAGVRLTLIAFLLLAAYASLRAVLRTRPRR